MRENNIIPIDKKRVEKQNTMTQKALLRFIHILSQEFRTPLSTIMGLSHVLQYKDDAEESLKNQMRVINEACNHMMPLLEHCKYFLSMHSGNNYSSILFDLRQHIEKIILEKNNGQVTFFLNYPLEVPHKVRGELLHINTVLEMLIDNAMRYTTRDIVYVDVGFNPDSSTNFRLKIHDYGNGIAPEKLKGIFDLFAIEDNNEYKNCGVKLSICKHIMNGMDGDLTIESDERNGTTYIMDVNLELQKSQSNLEYSFWNFYRDKIKVLVLNDDINFAKYLYQFIPLPKKQIATIREAKPLLQQAYLDEDPYQIILLDDTTLEKEADEIAALLAALPPLHESLFLVFTHDSNNKKIRLLKNEVSVGIMSKPLLPSKINRDFLYNWMHFNNGQCQKRSHENDILPSAPFVLLVEDNDYNRYVGRLMLEKLGCRVDAVTSGEAAINLVKNSQKLYNLLIIDIGLPDRSGIEVAPIIKSLLPKDYDLPMIALTAFVNEINKEQCQEVGINEMLTKPLLMQDLRNILRQYIPSALHE